MFMKVLYVNPNNSFDKEVRYLSQNADVNAAAPSGKAPTVVTLCDNIPEDFILYDSVRTEMFL